MKLTRALRVSVACVWGVHVFPQSVQYLLQTVMKHRIVLYAACWDLHFKRNGDRFFFSWREGSCCWGDMRKPLYSKDALICDSKCFQITCSNKDNSPKEEHIETWHDLTTLPFRICICFLLLSGVWVWESLYITLWWGWERFGGLGTRQVAGNAPVILISVLAVCPHLHSRACSRGLSRKVQHSNFLLDYKA